MIDSRLSEELDYEELEREVLAQIAENKLVTLATSAGDHVTARTVAVINDGLEIYFQSATTTTKNRQIAANPNVALSTGTFRLEGTAVEIGRPLDNEFFARVYPETHPDAFKQYSARPVTRLFAVRPRRATLWKFDPQTGPLEVIVDLEQRTATRNPALSSVEWGALTTAGG